MLHAQRECAGNLLQQLVQVKLLLLTVLGIGIGDVADVLDIVVSRIQRVDERNPRGVATEVLQTIGCNLGSVATVHDGSSLALGQTLLHLFLGQHTLLHDDGKFALLDEHNQRIPVSAVLAVLLLVGLLGLTDFNQTCLHVNFALLDLGFEVLLVGDTAVANEQHCQCSNTQNYVN